MTRLRARLRRTDDGFTLVEMLVSMAVLSVVMLLVTGAVLLASGTSARVEAASTSQQGAHLAFDSLDRQVRWASAFSAPGQVGTSTFVEWLSTSGSTTTCQQLRLSTTTATLQQRSWPVGSPSAATGWRTLASGVSASTPFAVAPADATSALQRLTVRVVVTAGGAKGRDSATHDVTYTALNSAGNTVTTACSGGRTP